MISNWDIKQVIGCIFETKTIVKDYIKYYTLRVCWIQA